MFVQEFYGLFNMHFHAHVDGWRTIRWIRDAVGFHYFQLLILMSFHSLQNILFFIFHIRLTSSVTTNLKANTM